MNAGHKTFIGSNCPYQETYNTLTELLEDYEEIAYRPAKKGELMVTHPNMFTGSNENVLSVSKCSSNMKYIYSRIVRKK